MGAIEVSVLEAAGRDLAEKLQDPIWRICSGELYKIMIKGEKPEDDLVLPFKPNRAQRRFIKRLWHRNLILKARQLGFTTLICILWLDHALFNPNVRCGIIAQGREQVEAIFRDKVKFAYENLPPELLKAMPLKKDSATELLFAHNNSSVRVGTSMRSGTFHRLHISEFGKICKESDKKATEVITGSIPTVPTSGVLVIESTAEGNSGPFHDMVKAAEKLMQSGASLNPKEYRLHFYPWQEEPSYTIDPSLIRLTVEEKETMDAIEAVIGVKLAPGQRAWYIATKREFEMAGKGEKMLQEYPSTIDEAFQRSVEGLYFPKEMAAMRKQHRICKIPILDLPCNTFWDIGGTAGTAVWIHQQLGLEDRMIGYIEEHGEPFSYFVRKLNQTGYMFNKHFLPHDAGHKQQLGDVNKSSEEMLQDLGLKNTIIVPRVNTHSDGIELMRKHFPSIWIDEERCAKGIERLDGYKKKFDATQGMYRNEPEKHDGNSEAADALRQFAQAKDAGRITIADNTSSMGMRPAGDWRA